MFFDAPITKHEVAVIDINGDCRITADFTAAQLSAFPNTPFYVLVGPTEGVEKTLTQKFFETHIGSESDPPSVIYEPFPC
jgi:hypothetical protein